MSGTPTAAITGLGLWMPGFPSVAAFASGVAEAEPAPPSGDALGRIHRRRASALCRAVADAAQQAIAQAGVDAALLPLVVGSAIGEASTLVGLLEQMWRLHTPMSPAAFTGSVHNSAAGLLSIAQGNRGYATSIAADADTPAAALMEALGLMHERGGPVLVVCADEAVPARFVDDEHDWELVAAALVLAPAAHATDALARLELVPSLERALLPAPLPPVIARNPQVGLVDLLRAVLAREPGVVALDRGRGRGAGARLDFEERR